MNSIKRNLQLPIVPLKYLYVCTDGWTRANLNAPHLREGGIKYDLISQGHICSPICFLLVVRVNKTNTHTQGHIKEKIM